MQTLHSLLLLFIHILFLPRYDDLTVWSEDAAESKRRGEDHQTVWSGDGAQ